jgi:DnaJ-class molecular chaperone
MITTILIRLAAVVVYALVCLVSSTRRCARCGGTSVCRNESQVRTCAQCRGAGRTRRIGATTVHRFVWSAARRDDN